MSNAFFLPVGRDVMVECINNYEFNGELKGVINFGGIPAIWLQSNDNNEIKEHILLIQNVVGITIIKDDVSKILDGGLFK